jgi:tRNA threonylcarbamoyladenosine biosynthesis protein TsaB
MITLAFDTATDRCSVAASDGIRTSSGSVDGARRHAAAILGLIDHALREVGGAPADIGRVLIGDGPGSFTGLRVAASVAKALVWQRRVEWRTAPSLLVRAAAHAPVGGGRVLAVSDALRGELYAGCWQITPSSIAPFGTAPRAMTPESLRSLGDVAVVVGTIPDPLLDRVRVATGREPVTGEAALPDARTLLALAGIAGGTQRVEDAATWEPEYGRPAEAQAVWERTHGTGLPVAPRIAR